MRVVVLNAQVPFIRGGAEVLADGLVDAIAASGHEVDLVRVPFKWYPPQSVLDAIVGSRLLDLTSSNGQKIDRLITLKFPSYFAPHPNKTLWLVHQHRSAYDMWDTGTADLNVHPMGEVVRDAVISGDNRWLPDHKRIFTISKNVRDRLHQKLPCDAEVLYPPVSDANALKPEEYGDFFLLPSRINPSKRQHLFVEALSRCTSRPKIIISGPIEDGAYYKKICDYLHKSGRHEDVSFTGMIDRSKLIGLYNRCRGVLFSPQDEDYGYVTLEAFYAGKPVITANDSGGPLEFVLDDQTGIVTDLTDISISAALDKLWLDVNAARRLGRNALAHIHSLNITWPETVAKLLSQ